MEERRRNQQANARVVGLFVSELESIAGCIEMR
jgi:hypothetical protein